jgi:RNA polymerase sigma-70 factor, ECF subfamily
MRQAEQAARTELWFERLFADHYDLVAHYALRRTGSREDAADVAAETLLVAWRRREQAPEGDVVRLWLYGIARRVLANQTRSNHRRDRLIARLRSEPTPVLDARAQDDRDQVDEILHRMRPGDREILTLVAVEGLTPAEAATVLSCSTVSARVRLHRARARFARLMASVKVRM